jgi:hypothetical protein
VELVGLPAPGLPPGVGFCAIYLGRHRTYEWHSNFEWNSGPLPHLGTEVPLKIGSPSKPGTIDLRASHF